ncbi:LytR/AlgR family response regulator transcription factor [Rudanella lutea]|uniref:LytR/AlgR family response regulator transcription factor n=1 Tax=Rudanella lutea TaxID=451374 RepID=UPI00038206CC|nr:LytTR family DNA-binding domain-containing protein [Rudanella lutea]
MESLTNNPLIPVMPNFPASYQRGTQRIALPYLNRTVMISVDDITCLEGEGNYTFLYTRDRKKYLISKTLKEFERTLDGNVFLRVHKSHIVNLGYVRRGVLGADRMLRMADGREVAVSRRRLKEIWDRLNEYYQNLLN